MQRVLLNTSMLLMWAGALMLLIFIPLSLGCGLSVAVAMLVVGLTIVHLDVLSWLIRRTGAAPFLSSIRELGIGSNPLVWIFGGLVWITWAYRVIWKGPPSELLWFAVTMLLVGLGCVGVGLSSWLEKRDKPTADKP